MIAAVWLFILSTEPYRSVETADSVISCYQHEGVIYSLEVTNEATDKLLNGLPVTITPTNGPNPVCDRVERDYDCGNCHASSL